MTQDLKIERVHNCVNGGLDYLKYFFNVPISRDNLITQKLNHSELPTNK